MSPPRHYLRAWRESRGFTQREVIDRLAMMDDAKLPRTETSLSRIEAGKQVYTERMLLALAEVYDAEPADLIGSDPFKEGRIFDLLHRMNPAQREQAGAVLAALAEPRKSWQGPPPNDEPLARRPLKS
jgi:transcriptional regulator with XRE-family HTH domain